MFDGISFIYSIAEKPLTSRHISPETLRSGRYDPENLANSEFSIAGATEAFRPVPIADYAKENFYYMQAFTIFHYRKGSFTRRQNFNSFLILYTYDGTGNLEYNGSSHTLRSHDGILIDCRKPHFYEATDDWKVGVLHLQGPQAAYYCSEYERLGNPVFHENTSGRFHRYLEQLLEIYDSPSLHRDLRASHCIDGIFLYLLVLGSNLNIQKRDVPKNIQKAMKHMELHFTEPITLDDLASLTGNNKYHLSKEFKRYTGFSPHDYLIHLRINQAKVLLKTTNLPANKIALEVGIHDINNFNYLFKKRLGLTPIQYRNSPDSVL